MALVTAVDNSRCYFQQKIKVHELASLDTNYDRQASLLLQWWCCVAAVAAFAVGGRRSQVERGDPERLDAGW